MKDAGEAEYGRVVFWLLHGTGRDDPNLHEAELALANIPGANRTYLARAIRDLPNAMTAYLELCTEHGIEPEAATPSDIETSKP